MEGTAQEVGKDIEQSEEPGELAEPLTLHLPGGVVARRNVYQRRQDRKAAALRKIEDLAQADLAEVNDEMGAAQEALQDHRDDEYLRKRKDPADTPYAERDAEDIQAERQLVREVEKCARAAIELGRKKNAEIEETPEHRELVQIADDYSDWLDGVFAYYGTFAHRVNWEEGTYTKYVEHSTVLAEFLPELPE